MSTLPPTVRTTSLALLAAGAVVSLSGCGMVQSFLGAGNVMDLEVGDCFTESEMNSALSGTEITDVPVVECTEPHDSEFFHSEILPDGDFPGDDAVRTTGEEVCQGAAFTEFVGVEWEESEVYASFLSPIEQGWDLGDREILCYVIVAEPVSESLEGAGR
ncbi:septum formation family protein [Nocardiopsis sp. MG754419]|uniref:septum formation family protein n=1 Tax=Nocardiopsis sp. MG754419 TaxID=2259865 RepID=UPI001BA4B888|nr:septum formation family protein [Nocardiopsis sp. MG754419]MBR8744448.1 septum formation family protein [Nocardiopsis sp. MG754419]